MRKIVILLLTVLVLIFFGLAIKSNNSSVKPENKTPRIFQTQTNSEGEVTVEVTPISLSDKDVAFKIILNTHSVALDKDLGDISILLDDRGKEYQAISWDGGTGGHHLEGVLIFPPISSKSKSATLIIKSINNIDREFLFPL